MTFGSIMALRLAQAARPQHPRAGRRLCAPCESRQRRAKSGILLAANRRLNVLQSRNRIHHYGLLATSVKADNLVPARKLLDVAPSAPEPEDISSETDLKPCPCCGSAMRIIEVFKAGESPRHRPTAVPAAIRIDTS